MIINTVIFLFIVVLLFYRYRETVVILAPLIPLIQCFKFPFYQTSNLFGIITLVIIILLPFKIKNDNKLYPYPFKFLTILVIISYFMSSFYNNGRNLSSTLVLVSSIYIFPIILWQCLNSTKTIDLFVKSLMIFLACICLYAIYELFTNSNPIIEFFISNNIASVNNSDRMRYGFKRLQSFLTYNGAFGLTCGLGFVTLTYLHKHFKQHLKVNKALLIPLQISLTICAFLTGTRSVIAGFMVGTLTFFDRKFIKTNISRYLLIVVISYVLINFCTTTQIIDISNITKYFSEITMSFKNTDNVEGSSTDLRTNQINFTLYYWAQSPILGHGSRFTNGLTTNYYDEIFGLESVWFMLLIDYGAIGCVVFFLSILLPIIALHKNGMSFLSFLPLMFLVNKTLSSVPGISIGFHLIFVVFFLKCKLLTVCDIKNSVQSLPGSFNR